jgi:uncharacterized membrane protein YkgB
MEKRREPEGVEGLQNRFQKVGVILGVVVVVVGRLSLEGFREEVWPAAGFVETKIRS